MAAQQICPECGASWEAGMTCETYFHHMLFWESENTANWAVHHLAVLCYHLQHPTLYSPEGLSTGKELLVAFVQEGRSPAEMRQASRDKVNSLNRDWKITARPDSKGAYAHPVTWTLTAADVIRRGEPCYCESVREWAQSMVDALDASRNLS